MTHPTAAAIDTLRETHVGRLLLRAHRAFAAEAMERLRALGHATLGVRHASVLPFIDRRGTRSTDIARRAGMTKQSMSALVGDLVAEGYVRLEPDPDDARAARVVFTAKGLRYLEDAHRVKQDIEDAYAALLGKKGFAALREGLQRIVARAGTPQDAPGD